MDKNKIVILALGLLIVALIAGIAISMPTMSKQDTKLAIKSNETLKEGDSILVRLTDANGTALANQTVNVTITDKDKSSSHYSVVTNGKGVGKLNIDKNPGKYKVTVNYAGNDSYAASNATKKITIEKKVVEATQSSSNNDPGAFYSAQYGGMVYTGDVHDSPAGPMRHLGNNQWEPAN